MHHIRCAVEMFEKFITYLLKATLRYKASLDPDSAEAEDVDALIGRWVSFLWLKLLRRRII